MKFVFGTLRIAFLFSLLLLLGSCRVHSQVPVAQKDNSETVINTKLGQNTSRDYNTSRTFVLVQQNRNDDHSLRRISYIVLKLADNSVAAEGSFQSGYIKWITDDSLEVLDAPQQFGNQDAPKLKRIISLKSTQP